MKLAAIIAGVAFACPACAAISQPLFAATHPPHGVARELYYKGDWRLDVVRDRFTQSIACRLRAHGGRQLYRSGAVGFAVGARNAQGAVYRLDGGDAIAARSDLPRLLARRVPLDRGGLDNPSGGYVWIPFDRLVGTGVVAIEPSPGARPKVVRLTGLVPLHDLAVERGCTPDGVFVER